MIAIREHGGIFDKNIKYPHWYLEKEKWRVAEGAPFVSSSGDAVSVKEHLYVVGAHINGIYNTDMYSLDTNFYTFTQLPSNSVRRDLVGAIIYKDRYLYVIGGRYNNNAQAAVEMYDIQNKLWEVKSDLPKIMTSPNLCVYKDYIYVVGGSSAWGGNSTAFLKYSITTDVWEELPEISNGIKATFIDNSKIYTFGRDFTSVYEIETDEWNDLKAPPVTLASEMKGKGLGKFVYLFDSTQTLKYDIDNDLWSNVPSKKNISTSREYTVGISQKSIYSIGGLRSTNRTNDVEALFLK